MNKRAVPVLNESLLLNEKSMNGRLTTMEIRGLKYNVLSALKGVSWVNMEPGVRKMIAIDKDIKVVSLGKEVLKSFK